MKSVSLPVRTEVIAGLSCAVSLPAGPVTGLVILLHGSTHSGRAIFRRSAALIRMLHPHVAIYAPNGCLDMALPDSHVAQSLMGNKKQTAAARRDWFHLPSPKEPFAANVTLALNVGKAIDHIHLLLDHLLQRHALDETSTALIGFSQGGIVATHVGVERAKPCRGIYNFCGLFFDPVSYLFRQPPRSAPPVFYGLVEGDEVLGSALMHASLDHFKKYKLPVSYFFAPAEKQIERVLKPSGEVISRVVRTYRQSTSRIKRDPASGQCSVQSTAHYVPSQMLHAAVLFSQGIVFPQLGTNILAQVPVSKTTKVGVVTHLAFQHASPKSAFGRIASLSRLLRRQVRIYLLNPFADLFGKGLPITNLHDVSHPDFIPLEPHQARTSIIQPPKP